MKWVANISILVFCSLQDHLLLEKLLLKEEVMHQGHKNVTQEVEMVAMGGEAAIGARAVNEVRAGQPWGYICQLSVTLIFCKQGQSNVLVYMLLGLYD